MDVPGWLRSIGLPEYISLFAKNHIDEVVLPHIAADDLRDLGIASVGHRRRILDAIAAISGGDGIETVRVALAPSSERRPVTVLFADLCGYTQLSQDLDDEELHRVANGYLTMAAEIVRSHGGTVEKNIGDAVMALFGAPIAHDDDVVNAARAALELQARMPSLSRAVGHNLKAHVGLAMGEAIVSTGTVGQITVVGASVNVAARVTSATRAGEVLVTDTVGRLISHRFGLEDRGEFEAKGITEPVHIWRLLSEGSAMRAATPFVGRRAELSEIDAALRGCAAGGCGVLIHIRGEPGIGKTRLVAEAINEATNRGFATTVTHALNFGAGHARNALRLLSTALVGINGTTAPPVENTMSDIDEVLKPFLLELIDAPLPEEMRSLLEATPEARRRAAREEVVASLVRAAVTRSPLLLVVEDVHWADEELAGTLLRVADLTALHPLALLTTSRPENEQFQATLRERPRGVPSLTLDLGPLRESEAAQLAASMGGVSVDLRRRCVSRAAGNPLFLDQLLRNAAELNQTDVPPSLRGLIVARMDRLSLPDRQGLQAASVLGQHFDPAALRYLLAAPEFDPAPLVRAGLLRSVGGELVFGHALIQEAVYRSLLLESSRALHRLTAEWYRDRDVILHAVHLGRAGDPEVATAYARAAADRLERYRSSEALTLVETGIALAASGPGRAELSLLRGEILLDSGRARDAAGEFEAALSFGLEPGEECRARLGLAQASRILDDIARAQANLDIAQSRAAALGSRLLLSRCHHLRGNLLFPTGRVEECYQEHLAALEMAEMADDSEARARALGGLGDAEYMRGRMRSAGAHFRRSVEESLRAGLGRTEASNRPMVALALLHELRLNDMLEEARVSVERARLMTQPRAELVANSILAQAFAEMGRDCDSTWHLEECRRITRELEAWRFEPENLAYLAEIDLRAGKPDEARAKLGEALGIARRTGMAYCGALVLALLARTEHDPVARKILLDEAEDLLATIAVSHNHWLGRRHMIEVGWELHDPDMILHNTMALSEYASREPTPFIDAIAKRGGILARTLLSERTAALVDDISELDAFAQSVGSTLLRAGLEEARCLTRG